MDKKDIEPTPNHFDSYEDAADFWDKHDTTDYLDEFRTVTAETEFRQRFYEIQIDESVAKLLREKAKQQGTTTRHLASEILRKQLHAMS
jgi:hypothetical protein